MNLKTENWSGHTIRFVEKEPGDWWAVAIDICAALTLKQVTRALNGLNEDGVTIIKVMDDLGRAQPTNIVNEKSIYRLIFKSRKPEAEAFQDWVCDVIKTLRQASGLEAFQVFRMLDREHQLEAMKRLHDGLNAPARVDSIKANTIANKAVSLKHGHAKMVKKNDMPPEWLAERQPVLDDTVALMAADDKFGLGLSVSALIYRRHTG